MKIAIASDLHLEIDDLDLRNTCSADVLVLAGDIFVANDLHDHPPPEVPYTPEKLKTLGIRQRMAKDYRDFIGRVSSEFKHVIAIAGNHEFYNGKWIQGIDTLRKEWGAYHNVHFLERDVVTIDGTTFVGGTLWTDMNKGDPITLHQIGNIMNDYRIIRHDGLGYTKLRPAHTVERHRKTIGYFQEVIDQLKDQKIVVVSHMAPSAKSIHEKYVDDRILNGAYYSDLSDFILDRPQIMAWLHGHVHTEFDYQIGSCRVVCNPRGYVGYERARQNLEPYIVKCIDV